MERYKGTLKITYLNEAKSIDYDMDNLGGSAHIYIRDKRGRYHTFFYRKHTKTWELSGNYPLKWPRSFMDVLFAAFDIERERWGL